MKDIYSFVAKKNNAIMDCDSYQLNSKDDAYEMAGNLSYIYMDVNIVEIFKYENKNFVFIGSVEVKE